MTRSSEIYGSHVFDLHTMRKKLPKKTFQALQDAIDKGNKLQVADAEVIAQAMMDWAIGMGVTHYTHWFQPMTGLTAQKHDSFFTFDDQLNPLDRFSGNQLIQSEPDASSFPSGGMRSTFEARGYTAWDPSSPVFVMASGDVSFLCIPSVFFSYTGHSLDKKTPLMKSTKGLDRAASRAVELFSQKQVRVHATVGTEQEYFLVDQTYHDKRPDLIMAGRTVLGTRPAKGQQMEDHYFGTIKDRVLSFMQDLEQRLYMLGVPCKTRHNEVAPHQFEMAPVFENANLAADHNQVAMDVMRKVAREHGLVALLHEKPFADVNGSGKHVNWSMQTSTGANLLEPGQSPHKNLRFLYFLVAVINAIHKRGGVLRSTIASAGNDHRLGANEAPPAIMSVFLGSHLTEILGKIESAEALSESNITSIDLGLNELPHILRDTTDRNRTSPFAFTGNKFEFRAVGSSQSISIPVAFLNAAVAESLDEMNAALEKMNKIDEKSIFGLLRDFIKKSKPVRFEGNNYSAEWAREAESRGLDNYKTTPEALSVWEKEDVRSFIHKSGILNLEETVAHAHVRLEYYAKTIDIEANLLLRLVDQFVLPASFQTQTDIAQSIQALQTAIEGGHPSVKKQREHLTRIATNIEGLLAARQKLEAVLDKAVAVEDVNDQAGFYAKEVRPAMDEARKHADVLETMADSRYWGLPTYHELLFLM